MSKKCQDGNCAQLKNCPPFACICALAQQLGSPKTRTWFTQVPVVVALAAVTNAEREPKSHPQPLLGWLVHCLVPHPPTHTYVYELWTWANLPASQLSFLFNLNFFSIYFILLFALFSFVLNFRSPIHSSIHRAGRRANSTFTFIF